jgi:hypothetical protein
MISRRQFITNGGLLVFAATVPTIISGLSARANGAPVTASQVTTSKDPSFNQLMDTLFPGLRERSNFSRLLPSSILLTNLDSRDAFGYALLWDASTTGGSPDRYARSFLSYPSTQLSIRQYTGQEPVLQAGETALVNPLFFWTTSLYTKKYAKGGMTKKRLLRYSSMRPTAYGFALRNASAQIAATVGAVVYADSISGSGIARETISGIYCNSRNGEHDEALRLLKYSTDATGGLNQSVLLQNINNDVKTFRFYAEQNKEKYYMHSRAIFANKVRHLVNAGGGIQQVQSILKMVAALPKLSIA